jgi:hypothetical protein
LRFPPLSGQRSKGARQPRSVGPDQQENRRAGCATRPDPRRLRVRSISGKWSGDFPEGAAPSRNFRQSPGDRRSPLGAGCRKVVSVNRALGSLSAGRSLCDHSKSGSNPVHGVTRVRSVLPEPRRGRRKVGAYDRPSSVLCRIGGMSPPGIAVGRDLALQSGRVARECRGEGGAVQDLQQGRAPTLDLRRYVGG